MTRAEAMMLVEVVSALELPNHAFEKNEWDEGSDEASIAEAAAEFMHEPLDGPREGNGASDYELIEFLLSKLKKLADSLNPHKSADPGADHESE